MDMSLLLLFDASAIRPCLVAFRDERVNPNRKSEVESVARYDRTCTVRFVLKLALEICCPPSKSMCSPRSYLPCRLFDSLHPPFPIQALPSDFQIRTTFTPSTSCQPFQESFLGTPSAFNNSSSTEVDSIIAMAGRVVTCWPPHRRLLQLRRVCIRHRSEELARPAVRNQLHECDFRLEVLLERCDMFSSHTCIAH